MKLVGMDMITIASLYWYGLRIKNWFPNAKETIQTLQLVHFDNYELETLNNSGLIENNSCQPPGWCHTHTARTLLRFMFLFRPESTNELNLSFGLRSQKLEICIYTLAWINF